MPDAKLTRADEPWLAVLRISGEDRVSFLQGQLTQDVALLGPDRPVALSASCDAKGRVLALLTLIYARDSLYAAIRRDNSEAWMQHVLRFRLRAKVDISLCDAHLVATPRTDDALFDPRNPQRVSATDADTPAWQFGGMTETLYPDTTTATGLDDHQWRDARLRAGIADIGPATSGAFTPHMLNLDRLGAVSFRKGCYTGQEVVARTEHLGAVKRRAWLLQTKDGDSLEEGEKVFAGDRAAGRVASASGPLALAVLGNDYATADLMLENGRSLSRLT